MSLSALFIQLINGLAGASSLFLVSAGLSLIFGVTRIVNFAHGSLMMLGAYIAYSLIARIDGGIAGYWSAVLLAALSVGVIGVIIERLLLSRLYGAPEMLQLIATFGIVLIVKDVVLSIWGAEDLLGPRAPGLGGAVEILGRAVPQYDLLLIALAPLVLVALTWLLERTRWGVLVRAATEDREMTAALGVNQAWLFPAVFFAGATLAGLAGALALPREPANLNMDLVVIADVFVVTVVGGLGSIRGAFVAALIIGVVKALCIAIGTVSVGAVTIAFPKLTLVAEFIVMAIVLAVRPWGLLGKPPSTAAAPEQRELQHAPGRRFVLGAALAVFLLAGMPLMVDAYSVVLLTDILIFVLFAATLHFLMGPGGMVSFGHAAYLGLGAYAAALLARSIPMEARADRRTPCGCRGRAGVRLVQCAPVGRLSGDADARVCADRVVHSVSVGQPHRRQQRTDRHSRLAVGADQKRVLPPHAGGRGVGRRRVVADHLLAVWLRLACGARLCPSRARRRDRRAQRAMAGVRHRGRLRGHRRRALRVLQRQHLAGGDVDSAFGGRAGDGIAGRRSNLARAAGRRRTPDLAPGQRRAIYRILARGRGSDRAAPGARVSPRDRRRVETAQARERYRADEASGDRRPAVSPPLLVVDRISKSYGGVRALVDVSLEVAPGEKIAVIGPNGAGKTTLFNVLDGQLAPDHGRVSLKGKRLDGLPPHAIARLGIGRTFQVTATFGSMTVSENVRVALLSHRGKLRSLFGSVPSIDDRDAHALLARVGIGHLAARQCAALAYGDLKRVELAIALAGGPRLLLMDEPTAGMPPVEREELMQNVARVARENSAAVLFTEHDMDVVFKHADRIVVLDRGRVIASGAPADVRADPGVREAYLGSDDAA